MSTVWHPEDSAESYQHLFGPVPSRRLGMSLGVDLVVPKTCSFNCVYCESGPTTKWTRTRNADVSFESVKKEIDHFWKHSLDPDYMTFSGSGEPTLSKEIGRVISYIKKKRPDIKVAVLTNGSMLSYPAVRQDLIQADLVMPSLDAALQETFVKINRPCQGLDVETYIQGLEAFSAVFENKLFLEIFILPGYNDNDADLAALKKAVERIKPDRIELNTLDRPGLLSSLKPASRSLLCRIKDLFPNFDTRIIAAVKDSGDKRSFGRGLSSTILETILRRPCTAEDLVQISGSDIKTVTRCLTRLESENKIESVTQARGRFYQIKT